MIEQLLQLDPLMLARVQFAFTVSFHIIFPAFTIGLASWLAVVEWRWLRTRNPIYREVYRFWVKIFAVTFGMGVVSGVVLSYQFGTNWSVFSDRVGNIIGPLLGYEVLTAFFLEASFLGIMLFGWGRVSERMHFVSTCTVAVGTVISAFWILSANSWMQTPQGFEIGADGLLYPTSWMEIIFNPSFPYRLAHMLTAAYLTTAFTVGGVGAYYIYKQKFVSHGRIMLGMAMIMAVFVAPLQVVIGDLHGLNTLKYQPAKVAAMEGLYHTQSNVPAIVFGWPDDEQQKIRYSLEIPGLTSLILTHSWDGEVQGFDAFAEDERPPMLPVFLSFRVMVAIGMAMVLTGLVGAWLYWRKRLFTTRWFQLWCMAMTPSGFIAVLAGWFVTEIGRQPWVAQGVIRTAEAASPVLGPQLAFSLLAFVVVYLLVFGAGTYYILQLILKGPDVHEVNDEETYGSHHGDKKALIQNAAEGVKDA